MGRRRAALATFAGSSMSTLIAAAQAILLLPICIHAVGDKLYGSWLATGDLLLCLCAFDFGLPTLLIQRAGAAHAKNDNETAGRYFATGFLVLTAVAALLGGVLILTAPAIAHTFTHGHAADIAPLAYALRIAVLATMLTIVNYAFQGLSRAIQQTLWVNVASVFGSIAGFGVTYYLLTVGKGLEAIAFGLIVRSVISIAGGLSFLLMSRSTLAIRRALRWSPEVWKDYVQNSPALFASGLSYALMTNSQIAIAVLLLKPEIAVIYSITRRAAEFGKSFLDMIGYASVGGVAHLTASGDEQRIRNVYRELDATYFAAAAAVMSAYIAGNASFIHAWMGDAYFGGLLLTIIIAARTIAAGWSYFELSLLRASGEIKLASVAVMVECVGRLALMFGLTIWLGLYGLPLSGLISGIISGLWARRRQFAQLRESTFSKAKSLIARTTPLLFATVLAMLVPAGGWRGVLITVVIAGGISLAMSLLLENGLSAHLRKLQTRLIRRVA